MDASMDESGEVVGSKLYQTMRRIEPSFNFKDLKYRAFNQFLEAHTDVIEMTRPKDGSGDVVVHFTGREHITPPPVSADNENRAARLVDPTRGRRARRRRAAAGSSGSTGTGRRGQAID